MRLVDSINSCHPLEVEGEGDSCALHCQHNICNQSEVEKRDSNMPTSRPAVIHCPHNNCNLSVVEGRSQQWKQAGQLCILHTIASITSAEAYQSWNREPDMPADWSTVHCTTSINIFSGGRSQLCWYAGQLCTPLPA